MGTVYGKRMALVPATQAFSPFVVHLYGGTSVQKSTIIYQNVKSILGINSYFKWVESSLVSASFLRPARAQSATPSGLA